MLNKKYLGNIRKDLLAYAEKRRDVIKQAGDAQHLAKKAIFALQRDSAAEAKEALQRAGEILSGLYDKYKSDPRLFDEGSYKAGLEEFTEAALFSQFLVGEDIGEIKGFEIESEVYVGGLADVPGELTRYAIKSATEKNFVMVKKCHEAAEEIIGELIDMDLTGYNRTKFDQAKGALHKLEQVVYEVTLRN